MLIKLKPDTKWQWRGAVFGVYGKEFDKLQRGEAVEVKDEVGERFINLGYFIEAKEKEKIKTSLPDKEKEE